MFNVLDKIKVIQKLTSRAGLCGDLPIYNSGVWEAKMVSPGHTD